MISKSPYGDGFRYKIDPAGEAAKLDVFLKNHRKTVAVQGLGFVGSAMVAALSGAKDDKGKPIFNVIGVDLADENNYWKIAMVNLGKSPIMTSDTSMDRAYKDGKENRNLIATYSESAYSKADIVVVDIQLDINKKELGKPHKYDFTYDIFKKAIRKIADNIREGTLVIIETTVPPGTTEKVIYPIFEEAFKRRKLDIGKLCLAYSYERVMPGPTYLDSIINFYRVYSGINENSKKVAREFFEFFINTKDYPVYEMHSVTAAELAKVLENSFRATNIAFIQEWTEFADKAGVNLFDAIEAIRMRPTHKNIMFPGFGVGGYCLPKDALFADWSYGNFFKGQKRLEISLNAIATNDRMPDYTFKLLKEEAGSLKDRHLTILGVSYLKDVADTRYSPTEYFYDKCFSEGALINLHDPFVTYWEEKKVKINNDISSLKKNTHDIAVFTVRHSEYLSLAAEDIPLLLPGVKIIVDANNIINDSTAQRLSKNGITMIGIGKGHWKYFREIR